MNNRPGRPRRPTRARLEQTQEHLRDRSKVIYTKVLQQAGAVDKQGEPLPTSPDALVAWLRRKISPDTPNGTILPMRAAIRHALAAMGVPPEDIADMLPKTKGLPAPPRNALTAEQIVRYGSVVVATLPPGPVQTIALLLPTTGLRISEACHLRYENIVVRGGTRGLAFRGKRGKERFVPLIKQAARVLDDYIETYGRPVDPKTGERRGCVFPGGVVRDVDGKFTSDTDADDERFDRPPVTRQAVDKALRKVAKVDPSLGKLHAHMLRHSFATWALSRAVSLRELQVILGHENIQTTAVYTHPTPETLAVALKRMEGDP